MQSATEPHRRKASRKAGQRPEETAERRAFSHGAVWAETGVRSVPVLSTHRTRNGQTGNIPAKVAPSETASKTTNLTTSSLTPYGMSFWALILAACGGGGGGGGGSTPVVSKPQRDPVDDGGSTPVVSKPQRDPVDDGGGTTPVVSNQPPTGNTSDTMSLSGKVIDGPVEGASLFLLRPVGANEGPVKIYVGTSRRDGTYEVSAESRFADYILCADLANAIDHGEDLTSDRDNVGYGAGEYWRAPPGSTIISPLTEILGRVYGFRPTPAQKAAFSEHLGLPTTIDVTRNDPLSADMAPYRQQLFLLGQTANQLLQRWGDAPLNAGQAGQAYIDEINRLYEQKTKAPDKEPP